MKPIPLTVFSFAAIFGASAQAQSSIAIYGIVDVAVESIKSGQHSAQRVQSGGSFQSRLGFRGAEDLGGGNRAIFNLENRFAADDGSQVQGLMFGGRSIVGLSGQWGSVVLGREYIPIYQLKVASNPFGFTTYSSSQVMMRGGTTRSNNALRYDSAVWAGASFSAMYSTGDENSLNTNAGRHTGLAAQYRSGNWWAGAGVHRVGVDSLTVRKTQEYLAGLSYQLPMATLYANFWRLDSKNQQSADAETGLWSLGVSAPVSSHGTLMLTYARRDAKAPIGQSRDDATQFIAGYEHRLSKRTTAYAQYTRVKNQQGSNIMVSGFANAGAATGEVSDPRAFQVGIRHSF